MKVNTVGEGRVVLIAGGGRVFTDLAAKFVKTEKPVTDLVSEPYNKQLVKNILESGHLSALEFDYFLFGVEGYSRVTETQLVRKRIASYLIKSGRAELHGKRKFEVSVPKNVLDVEASMILDVGDKKVNFNYTGWDLLELMERWYEAGLAQEVPEQDLRYLKPQATSFKAIIGMNAHALRDWFKIRCCMNAQTEIRDLANKMLKLCKEAAPDLFEGAGASCQSLGYCPENRLQNKACRHVPSHTEVLQILRGQK